MKKVLSSLGTLVTTVIVICLGLAWPLGIYHSYKKHDTKDLIMSVVLPPFGWYMSAEMFWHKN